MDSLVFLIQSVLDFWTETVDFLLRQERGQLIRIFWAFFFLEIPRYLITDLYVWLRIKFKRREETPTPQPLEQPLVSVILPALNEEDTIQHTVRSLSEQGYPNLEIIVVDDGSTDRTPEICQEMARQGMIRFFRLQERAGKSAALNYGLKASHGEYLVFMDTDSTLDRGVMTGLLKWFQDENVGAISGNLGVRNRHVNLLTRLQALEYLVSITVGRRFRAEIGILSIVPGAFGAFRRTLLERIGGHEPGPGNDSDLTIRTRKLRKKVVFAPETCLTNVPVTWNGWLRQRMRWDRNTIRNRVRKHRDVFNFSQANFSFTNMVSFFDTIFFSNVVPLLWIVYILDIHRTYPDRVWVILFANYCLHILLKLAQLLIAIDISERKTEYMSLFFCVPLFGPYRILSKLVRLLATLQELLFRWSYKDPFAPEKVRKEMEVY